MSHGLEPYLKLSDAVVITDRRHFILNVNEAYERITGYSEPEVVGRRAGFLKTIHTPKETFDSMHQALGNEQAWSGVFTNRKRGGELWHSSISITPFGSGEELCFVGIFRELEGLQEGMYLPQNDQDRLQGAMLKMLALSCEIRDPGIERHLMRVQRFTDVLLRSHDSRKKLGLSSTYISSVIHSSILHDIGKSAIPEGILYKPAPLASYERMIIETHPQIGADILAKVTVEMNEAWLSGEWEAAKHIILYHHEKWNGTGYPHKLAGEQIPLEARIVSIVDVYDALVSRRSYKDSWSEEDALQHIVSQKGISFDPDIVDTFAAVREQMK